MISLGTFCLNVISLPVVKNLCGSSNSKTAAMGEGVLMCVTRAFYHEVKPRLSLLVDFCLQPVWSLPVYLREKTGCVHTPGYSSAVFRAVLSSAGTSRSPPWPSLSGKWFHPCSASRVTELGLDPHSARLPALVPVRQVQAMAVRVPTVAGASRNVFRPGAQTLMVGSFH